MGVKHKTTGDFSMPFLPQVHYKSYTECRLEQRGKGRLCLFCSGGLGTADSGTTGRMGMRWLQDVLNAL